MIRDNSYVNIGGSKKSIHKLLKKNLRSRTKKQLGSGCGCSKQLGGSCPYKQQGGSCPYKQQGGRVVKPNEYYGGDSGRYFAEGSTKLIPEPHAYGVNNPVSFGSISSDMTQSGPNLGPSPNTSGMMTGGKRRKRKSGKSGKSGKVGKSGKGKKRTSSKSASKWKFW